MSHHFCHCLLPWLPSTAEVLQRAGQAVQVCTATQCFESDADAFGVVHAPPIAQPLLLYCWGVVFVFFFLLVATAPARK